MTPPQYGTPLCAGSPVASASERPVPHGCPIVRHFPHSRNCPASLMTHPQALDSLHESDALPMQVAAVVTQQSGASGAAAPSSVAGAGPDAPGLDGASPPSGVPPQFIDKIPSAAIVQSLMTPGCSTERAGGCPWAS